MNVSKAKKLGFNLPSLDEVIKFDRYKNTSIKLKYPIDQQNSQMFALLT